MEPCLIAILSAVVMGDVVFDGSGIPEEQGWSIGGSTLIPPLPFFSDGSRYDMNTVGAPFEPGSGGMHLWSKDVGITTGFHIEMGLKVIDDTLGHNQFDAGIAFFAGYTTGFGTAFERGQMIYFDEDEVGWGDETDTFALDTTDSFHIYQLAVQTSGLAQLYVDGQLALERTGFTTNGFIAFGDQTNDRDVDGHFQLAFISVVPLPLPSCPADIAPAGGNGIVDVDDLLAVINSWGVCVNCPADIAPPPGGNDVVDVDDLLAVINNWGACE